MANVHGWYGGTEGMRDVEGMNNEVRLMVASTISPVRTEYALV